MSKSTPEDVSEAKASTENELEENLQDIVVDEELSANEEEKVEEPVSLEQALKTLAEAELVAQQAKDDLLRVQAEMQNLRRRTEQDVEKAHKYGQEKVQYRITYSYGQFRTSVRFCLAARR